MKTTMHNVAEHAGVDKATVSRVLKGDSRISEKTRIKVMDSVRALNYRPDLNARHLSTNKSGFIGVVFRELNVPWTSNFIAGLDRSMSNFKYDILIKCTDGDKRRAACEYVKLSDRGIESLILGDSENLPENVKIPTLTLGFKKEGAIALLSEKGDFIPTFETGAQAGRLLMKLIAGKPMPIREIIIKKEEEVQE